MRRVNRMTERVYIICHSKAGSGTGDRVRNEVHQLLENFSISHLTYDTNYATHAHLLAQNIISNNFDVTRHRLLVIGGDGTLHEVVNAIVTANRRIPITFIPAGTGNDFDRAWQKDLTTRQLVEKMIYQREPVNIPIGLYANWSNKTEGAFTNSIGAGIDAEINYAVINSGLKKPLNRMRLGRLTYLVSIFPTLSRLKLHDFNVIIDGVEHQFSNAPLAVVLSHPYFGGGINIDPLYDPNRKELTFFTIHNLKLSAVPKLLWQILVSKKHLDSPFVTRITGQEISVKCDENIRSQIDGEDQSQREIDYETKISDFPFFL